MKQIYFSPDTIQVTPNQEFSVDVMVDTLGELTDGVDVILNYQGLEVVSVVKGTVYSNTFQRVDPDKIVFSQVNSGSIQFIGIGTLFTLTFKALADPILSFQFTLGDTADTNLSQAGQDILTEVGAINLNNMIDYQIVPKSTITYDPSGNLVVFVNFYKDNELIINNRPLSIGHINNFKGQVQQILDQLQAADDLAQVIGNQTKLPDLTIILTPEEVKKKLIEKLFSELQLAQKNLELKVITQLEYDAKLQEYKDALAS